MMSVNPTIVISAPIFLVDMSVFVETATITPLELQLVMVS